MILQILTTQTHTHIIASNNLTVHSIYVLLPKKGPKTIKDQTLPTTTESRCDFRVTSTFTIELLPVTISIILSEYALIF
jgi:hypothetical protein